MTTRLRYEQFIGETEEEKNWNINLTFSYAHIKTYQCFICFPKVATISNHFQEDTQYYRLLDVRSMEVLLPRPV